MTSDHILMNESVGHYRSVFSSSGSGEAELLDMECRPRGRESSTARRRRPAAAPRLLTVINKGVVDNCEYRNKFHTYVLAVQCFSLLPLPRRAPPAAYRRVAAVGRDLTFSFGERSIVGIDFINLAFTEVSKAYSRMSPSSARQRVVNLGDHLNSTTTIIVYRHKGLCVASTAQCRPLRDYYVRIGSLGSEERCRNVVPPPQRSRHFYNLH
ncbi:hypothetical protein EVAR_54636_1 [Eumeta japonica]|uniref:Uncharacterized protein n=1 Tax=Eumeta variegata TaxID=151549 RepID=A0A4C1X612_EUMVA|nr:hypothetical protein EVAR_54636_1 [Eumeta japonica]